MDPEAGFLPTKHGGTSWRSVLILCYQSFGIVYGDVSISPLYVFKSSFAGIVKLAEDDAEILGVLSLIFWTFTLVLVVKYAFIVLQADDNGEGGTFALYSLLCRHANLSCLPNRQDVDGELSTYKVASSPRGKPAQILESYLHRHTYLRTVLLLVVLLGTCMVIGDGVLTPTISVLSAMSGIRVTTNGPSESVVVFLSCLILIGLFYLQHYGTHRVGFMFAPIVITWLLSIGCIGIYNICYWNPTVLKGLSPYYIYNFFRVTGRDGWMSLGGIVLCITGAEAMFVDMGHFSQLSIKLAFMFGVYPCLMLSYTGEAAFLSRNRDATGWSFYRSIPEPVFWPVFVIATLASIVGSQAIISATFSIVKQCSSLDCFPRVKIIHTSKNIFGRVYVPDINWVLMILCLAITLGFQDTTLIGNAYGLTVVTVMFVTTCLMSLIILIVWQRSVFYAVAFLLFFGSIELVYISSCLIKVHEGGWVPIVLAMIFLGVMYTWNYGLRKKYEFEVQNKVSVEWLLDHGPSLGIVRVPGIGLVYTDLVTGVPAVFSHFVTNLPAFHQIVVFVCVKVVPVPYIPPTERFMVGRIGTKEYRIFRCVVRYGYKDACKDENDFENQIIVSIVNFIQQSEGECVVQFPREGIELGSIDGGRATQERSSRHQQPHHLPLKIVPDNSNSLATSFSVSCDGSIVCTRCENMCSCAGVNTKGMMSEVANSSRREVEDELKEIFEAQAAGVSYIFGHCYMEATRSSSWLKKFAINWAFNFLRRNCRAPTKALNIPHNSLIEVGMIYHV